MNALLSFLRALTGEKIFRSAEILYDINDRSKKTANFGAGLSECEEGEQRLDLLDRIQDG